jgi:hypothetical protein
MEVVETEDLARLLAPAGALSRMEKDAIFERVIGQQRPWYRRRAWFIGAGALVAAACALLLLRPHAQTSTLTARGSDGVTLVVHCGSLAPGTCAPGDRLMLDFGSTPPDGYVALFARTPSGEVIWYAPPADSASIPLRAAGGVLDTAIVLDGYAPGTYQLFAVMSDAPLLRAEIRSFARGDQLVAPPGVRLETRTFTVQETR